MRVLGLSTEKVTCSTILINGTLWTGSDNKLIKRDTIFTTDLLRCMFFSNVITRTLHISWWFRVANVSLYAMLSTIVPWCPSKKKKIDLCLLRIYCKKEAVLRHSLPNPQKPGDSTVRLPNSFPNYHVFFSCPPGFMGDFCEVDVNECCSAPCQNSAVCQDLINSYVCHCRSGESFWYPVSFLSLPRNKAAGFFSTSL